jgi:hypothetical protein
MWQILEMLQPVLDLPVEFMLPTHGEPADRAALQRALPVRWWLKQKALRLHGRSG